MSTAYAKKLKLNLEYISISEAFFIIARRDYKYF